MNDQNAPASAEGFRVVAVDADGPGPRRYVGGGYDRISGDIHVYLRFGSPHPDPHAEHVTVLSASAGNAMAGEALEDALEDHRHAGEGGPSSGLPASEPVTLTADGKPVTFELWRAGGDPRWVARGRVESTEVVLSGTGIDPRELRLIRVDDLAAYEAPHAFLPEREAISAAMGSDPSAAGPGRRAQLEEADTALRVLRDIAARNAALGGSGQGLPDDEAETVMRALKRLAQDAGPGDEQRAGE
ncbi:hypothetical protein AB0E83_13250 [Streptomyces sp. NPDC035033]|uniref:hypothetical protein n=1 Tax=Streptomyces sp. NPDC035033 TaxID=3155368 RepID=UPI0033F7FD67